MIWLWIILGLLLLGLIGYLIYKFWPNIKNLFKKTQTWTTEKKNEPSLAFNEQKKDDDPLDTNQLEENSKYH